MRTVCCQCKKDLGHKPGTADGDGLITHGLCEPCYEVQCKALDKRKRQLVISEHTKKHGTVQKDIMQSPIADHKMTDRVSVTRFPGTEAQRENLRAWIFAVIVTAVIFGVSFLVGMVKGGLHL